MEELRPIIMMSLCWMSIILFCCLIVAIPMILMYKIFGSKTFNKVCGTTLAVIALAALLGKEKRR